MRLSNHVRYKPGFVPVTSTLCITLGGQADIHDQCGPIRGHIDAGDVAGGGRLVIQSVCQMLVFPDTVKSVMSQVVTTFTMRMKTRQSRHPFQTIETTFLKYGGHILLFKINRNRNAFSAKDTAWIDLRQILSVHSKEHIQDIKIQ